MLVTFNYLGSLRSQDPKGMDPKIVTTHDTGEVGFHENIFIRSHQDRDPITRTADQRSTSQQLRKIMGSRYVFCVQYVFSHVFRYTSNMNRTLVFGYTFLIELARKGMYSEGQPRPVDPARVRAQEMQHMLDYLVEGNSTNRYK